MWHNLVSLIVFVSVSAGCFVFARRFGSQPAGRRWVAYSIITGVVVPAFLLPQPLHGPAAQPSTSVVCFSG
jgi:hypothetical protein